MRAECYLENLKGREGWGDLDIVEKIMKNWS
jgi:hypothetical protein